MEQRNTLRSLNFIFSAPSLLTYVYDNPIALFNDFRDISRSRAGKASHENRADQIACAAKVAICEAKLAPLRAGWPWPPRDRKFLKLTRSHYPL